MALRHYEGVGYVLQQREERHRRTYHEHGIGEQLLEGRYPLLQYESVSRFIKRECKYQAYDKSRDDGDDVRDNESSGALTYGNPNDVVAAHIRARHLVGKRFDDLRIGVYGHVSLGQREAFARIHHLDACVTKSVVVADFELCVWMVNLRDNRIEERLEEQHRLESDGGTGCDQCNVPTGALQNESMKPDPFDSFIEAGSIRWSSVRCSRKCCCSCRISSAAQAPKLVFIFPKIARK